PDDFVRAGQRCVLWRARDARERDGERGEQAGALARRWLRAHDQLQVMTGGEGGQRRRGLGGVTPARGGGGGGVGPVGVIGVDHLAVLVDPRVLLVDGTKAADEAAGGDLGDGAVGRDVVERRDQVEILATRLRVERRRDRTADDRVLRERRRVERE